MTRDGEVAQQEERQGATDRHWWRSGSATYPRLHWEAAGSLVSQSCGTHVIPHPFCAFARASCWRKPKTLINPRPSRLPIPRRQSLPFFPLASPAKITAPCVHREGAAAVAASVAGSATRGRRQRSSVGALVTDHREI
jgi:hypothetical protein